MIRRPWRFFLQLQYFWQGANAVFGPQPFPILQFFPLDKAREVVHRSPLFLVTICHPPQMVNVFLRQVPFFCNNTHMHAHIICLSNLGIHPHTGTIWIQCLFPCSYCSSPSINQQLHHCTTQLQCFDSPCYAETKKERSRPLLDCADESEHKGHTHFCFRYVWIP